MEERASCHCLSLLSTLHRHVRSLCHGHPPKGMLWGMPKVKSVAVGLGTLYTVGVPASEPGNFITW
jgi:hypothetical protein